jgi:molybdopterin/thiamine biosynthesis adenylyltransferase
VLAPVPGVIGTLMAVEALKLSAGIKTETGHLSLYDALSSDWRKVAIKKRRNCPTCRKN